VRPRPITSRRGGSRVCARRATAEQTYSASMARLAVEIGNHHEPQRSSQLD